MLCGSTLRRTVGGRHLKAGTYSTENPKARGNIDSLDEFRQQNPHAIAEKVHAGNFGYDVERDILSIPLYAVFALAEDIAQGKPHDEKGWSLVHSESEGQSPTYGECSFHGIN